MRIGKRRHKNNKINKINKIKYKEIRIFMIKSVNHWVGMMKLNQLIQKRVWKVLIN